MPLYGSLRFIEFTVNMALNTSFSGFQCHGFDRNWFLMWHWFLTMLAEIEWIVQRHSISGKSVNKNTDIPSSPKAKELPGSMSAVCWLQLTAGVDIVIIAMVLPKKCFIIEFSTISKMFYFEVFEHAVYPKMFYNWIFEKINFWNPSFHRDGIAMSGNLRFNL